MSYIDNSQNEEQKTPNEKSKTKDNNTKHYVEIRNKNRHTENIIKKSDIKITIQKTPYIK